MVDISKAPWTYEEEAYEGYREIYSNDGFVIAKVEAGDPNNEASCAEALQNTKRIVASNHLLASLQALLECAELNQDDLEAHTRAQIEVARIAIDLAIGKGSPA